MQVCSATTTAQRRTRGSGPDNGHDHDACVHGSARLVCVYELVPPSTSLRMPRHHSILLTLAPRHAGYDGQPQPRVAKLRHRCSHSVKMGHISRSRVLHCIVTQRPHTTTETKTLPFLPSLRQSCNSVVSVLFKVCVCIVTRRDLSRAHSACTPASALSITHAYPSRIQPP